MGRKSKKKALNRFNKKQYVNTATALWELAANKRNPNAIRILAEYLGLGEIVGLMRRKSAGESVDAEVVGLITRAIERTQVKS